MDPTTAVYFEDKHAGCFREIVHVIEGDSEII
jgi:hypothetical protein